MSDIKEVEYPTGTKPCRVCAEPIRTEAKKCTKCQSYQNWLFSTFGLSSTILSLIIALFSVLTVAVPVITEQLTPKNSNLVFAYQSADRDVLTMLVSNQGTRPGSVREGWVSVNFTQRPVDLRILNHSPVTLVAPGASIILHMTRTLPRHPRRGAGLSRCEVIFVVSDFTGKTLSVPTPVDCKEVEDFIIEPPSD